MPRNYVHLSGRDVDEAILGAYGLIENGKPVKPNVPLKCGRCCTLNPHDARMCHRCGFALSERVAFRKDDEIQELKKAVEEIRKAVNSPKGIRQLGASQRFPDRSAGKVR